MKKIVVILLLLFLLVGCGKKEELGGIASVTCDKALEYQVDGSVIVNIKEKDEYDEDHLENAINIPYTEIKDKIADFVEDFDTKIIVYCKSGKRSAMAAKSLIEAGYKNIYDLGSINNCS